MSIILNAELEACVIAAPDAEGDMEAGGWQGGACLSARLKTQPLSRFRAVAAVPF